MTPPPAPAPSSSWTIPPRTLPPPQWASPQLQQILAATPAPSAAPPPTTLEGWRQKIAANDATDIQFADELIRTWRVTVTEQTLAGVHTYRITPPQIAPEHASHLFLHIHGGAYLMGARRACLPEAVQIAGALKIPVLSIDYRMPPDYPAPAAMDDIIAVWRQTLSTHDPRRLALGGTSAGAALTLVSTLRMKDLHLPLPAALFVGTPACELGGHGDSHYINDGIDHILVGPGALKGAAALYAGSIPYNHPYLSPINGDFSNFPPTYLISGTRDLFLSDTIRTHRKLRRSRVDADLHLYEGFAHADYMYLPTTPESAEHYAELNTFLSRHLSP